MIERIRQCMRTALKLDEAAASAITPVSTAADVPGWTSVAHLALILELEKQFGIVFGNDEIASLASIPAILEAVTRKAGARQ
jgi:acyl carrier protein